MGDVEVSARRLMVPGSYKGRCGNSGSDPVPVGDNVIEVLLPAIAAWPSDAPAVHCVAAHVVISTMVKTQAIWPKVFWLRIRERAGMPEVIPYALRHSSIVRCLRKGLPIQQVAKLHNAAFLIAAPFLTKNVAPQLGTGVGSDVATCSASFSSVAFFDVGFNGRSHGRSRARCLRRGFCSGSSYGVPCRSHGLLEGQNPVGGLVIDVVGDANWLLLVVAAFVVIAPADKPNAAFFPLR